MGDGENKYISVKSPVFLLVRQKGWGSFLESEGFVRRTYLGCPMQAPLKYRIFFLSLQGSLYGGFNRFAITLWPLLLVHRIFFPVSPWEMEKMNSFNTKVRCFYLLGKRDGGASRNLFILLFFFYFFL